MGARNSPSGRRTGKILSAVLVALLTAAVGCPAMADELPALRQGMWNYQRMVGGKKIETTKCSSPSEDMKKQNKMLEKAGCRFSPAGKSGNAYTFTAECSIKGPSGAMISSRSTSVITVESDSAYRIEIDVVTEGQSTKERLVARRVGDCKP